MRRIQADFYAPFAGYSADECEFFRKPTQFRHFKERIDLIVKKHDDNTLVFIPPHEESLFKALKVLVLNKIPTVRTGIVRQIHAYLYEKFGKEGLKEIVRDYANYLKGFNNDNE